MPFRVLCKGAAVRYALMNKLRLSYTIPFLCRMLNVSPSGYYAWSSRLPSKHAQDEARIAIEIQAAHARNRQVAGPETIQRDLAEHGIIVGICRIRTIRKNLGIRCKQIKKFKATTDSKHTLPVADNLLQQTFTAEAPNQVWVSDISAP